MSSPDNVGSQHGFPRGARGSPFQVVRVELLEFRVPLATSGEVRVLVLGETEEKNTLGGGHV